jgi:signal peptidase I
MTGAPSPPAGRKVRILALVAGAILAVAAAALGWLTIGDTNGCTDGAPSLFSRIYHISSASMAPAIQEGDWLWAERRYYCTHEPRRGDLAIFSMPKTPQAIFVERIVGLPGDRVQLKQAQLYINGEPIARDWVESTIHTDASGESRQRTRFVETFPEHDRYAVEVADIDAPAENTEEITVPAGQYFVLGDNRDQSLDSRMGDFGLVPRGFIADRPALVAWSSDLDRVGLGLGAR